MSAEENKVLIRRVVEYWNQRDLDGYFSILAPEYVEHLPDGDVPLEELKKYAGTFFNAFPDIKFSIEDIVAEEDMVALRIRWQGTHRGIFMGVPPSGKNIDVTNAIFVKIAKGKWVEFWNVTDASLILQIGTE
jgi:steroid delta-isomerase-like uncharacterized protein